MFQLRHIHIDISKTVGNQTDIDIPKAALHCEETAIGLQIETMEEKHL